MAAFGSFAGLAAAGAGALCSVEEEALNSFFLRPPSFKTSCDVQLLQSGPLLPSQAKLPAAPASEVKAGSLGHPVFSPFGLHKTLDFDFL